MKVCGLFFVSDFNSKAYLIYGAAKSEQRLKEPDSEFLGTAASLAKRSPLPDYPEQTLRLINDRYPDGKLQPGEEIKLIQ